MQQLDVDIQCSDCEDATITVRVRLGPPAADDIRDGIKSESWDLQPTGPICTECLERQFHPEKPDGEPDDWRERLDRISYDPEACA